MKKKAAVVGLGIGMAHVAGYLASDEAELYAVCDRLPERLASVGGTFEQGSMLCIKPLFDPKLLGTSWEELGVKTFTSLDSLLEDDKVEIISLCTPDYLHVEHMQKIVKKEIVLLLEKPVGIRAEDLNTLRTFQDIPVSALAVGYEFRINPVIQRLKKLIDQGEAGTIEAFSLYHFRDSFRRDKWEHWIQSKEKSGGLIVEETSHWLDLARFITGKEPESLDCVKTGGVYADFDYEDIAYIQGGYRDGGIFQISHALTGFDFSLQICVHGTKGTFWCQLKEARNSILDGGYTPYIGVLSWAKPGASQSEATVEFWQEEALEPWNIAAMVQKFCKAQQHPADQKELCSMQDGMRALELALLALESAETGKRVIISC